MLSKYIQLYYTTYLSIRDHLRLSIVNNKTILIILSFVFRPNRNIVPTCFSTYLEIEIERVITDINKITRA